MKRLKMPLLLQITQAA